MFAYAFAFFACALNLLTVIVISFGGTNLKMKRNNTKREQSHQQQKGLLAPSGAQGVTMSVRLSVRNKLVYRALNLPLSFTGLSQVSVSSLSLSALLNTKNNSTDGA